jgi:hypothetical protein
MFLMLLAIRSTDSYNIELGRFNKPAILHENNYHFQHLSIICPEVFTDKKEEMYPELYKHQWRAGLIEDNDFFILQHNRDIYDYVEQSNQLVIYSLKRYHS